MQCERAALGERERPQIVDQACEDLGLLEDRRDVRGVGRMHAVEERLDVALHDRERRAQLMRHIGEELLALRFIRAEARGHRVERVGE